MEYEVHVSFEAKNDLIDAFGWYESKRIGLGDEFIFCVDATVSLIQRNPVLFPIIMKETGEDIYRALVSRFPYEIYYYIRNDKVTIFTVLHAKMDPGRISKRFQEDVD